MPLKNKVNKVKGNNVKRASNFSDEETTQLVAIWGDYIMSGKFKGVTRHDIIWQEIQDEHNFETIVIDTDTEPQRIRRYNRGWDELRSKINNLKAEYSKEKGLIKSGSSPSTWKYFEKFSSVLGSRAYHNDTLQDDSLNISIGNTFQESDMTEEMLELEEEFFDDDGNVVASNAPSDRKKKRTESPSSEESSSSSSPSTSTSAESSNTSKKIFNINQARRQKAPNTELLRQVVAGDKKFIEIYESGNKYVEKSYQLDERMVELEEARNAREEQYEANKNNAMLAMTSFFNVQAALVQQQLTAGTNNHGAASFNTILPTQATPTTSQQLILRMPAAQSSRVLQQTIRRPQQSVQQTITRPLQNVQQTITRPQQVVQQTITKPQEVVQQTILRPQQAVQQTIIRPQQAVQQNMTRPQTMQQILTHPPQTVQHARNESVQQNTTLQLQHAPNKIIIPQSVLENLQKQSGGINPK